MLAIGRRPATQEKPLPPVKGRNIMIVVDSSAEAKGALHWALMHTIQNNDTLLLLLVVKPGRQRAKAANGERDQESAPRNHQRLQSVKSVCQSKRPEVRVERASVKGNEPGDCGRGKEERYGAAQPGTEEEHLDELETAHDVGQEKGWGVGAVESCIHNADCMAIAVRRKSKKLGGNMITTKRQKDFWLLA